MSTATLHRLTADEYLALERAAVSKSEFFEGEMIPMSGGTLRHDRICLNLLLALVSGLKSRGFGIFTSNTRVLTPGGLFTYPDVSVVAEEPQLDDDCGDMLENPLLLIEVLSPSTEAYDRGAKFDRYREIETLKTYVLVSQETRQVEVFSRGVEGGWTSHMFRTGVVTIPEPQCDIELAAIYDQVNLTAKGTR